MVSSRLSNTLNCIVLQAEIKMWETNMKARTHPENARQQNTRGNIRVLAERNEIIRYTIDNRSTTKFNPVSINPEIVIGWQAMAVMMMMMMTMALVTSFQGNLYCALFIWLNNRISSLVGSSEITMCVIVSVIPQICRVGSYHNSVVRAPKELSVYLCARACMCVEIHYQKMLSFK